MVGTEAVLLFVLLSCLSTALASSSVVIFVQPDGSSDSSCGASTFPCSSLAVAARSSLFAQHGRGAFVSVLISGSFVVEATAGFDCRPNVTLSIVGSNTTLHVMEAFLHSIIVTTSCESVSLSDIAFVNHPVVWPIYRNVTLVVPGANMFIVRCSSSPLLPFGSCPRLIDFYVSGYGGKRLVLSEVVLANSSGLVWQSNLPSASVVVRDSRFPGCGGYFGFKATAVTIQNSVFVDATVMVGAVSFSSTNNLYSGEGGSAQCSRSGGNAWLSAFSFDRSKRSTFTSTGDTFTGNCPSDNIVGALTIGTSMAYIVQVSGNTNLFFFTCSFSSIGLVFRFGLLQLRQLRLTKQTRHACLLLIPCSQTCRMHGCQQGHFLSCGSTMGIAVSPNFPCQ
jgi:hypothetical protein